MKKGKLIIIILTFFCIIGIAVAVLFIIVRNNPSVHLKLKRGWDTETLAMVRSSEEDEFTEEFWLSTKDGILYTDVYFTEEHEWFLSPTSTRYGEWAYLPIGNMQIDKGNMKNITYVSVARFADEKAFSGKIEEKGLDVTVLLVPSRSGLVQYAVARAELEDDGQFLYTDLINKVSASKQ